MIPKTAPTPSSPVSSTPQERSLYDRARRAVSSHNADALRIALSLGAPLYGWERSDGDLLTQACERSLPDCVRALLDAGADPNDTTRLSASRLPLMIACSNNDVATARVLIEGGANVNAVFWSACALNWASGAESALLLLSAGANPNLQTADMSPPIFSAIRRSFNPFSDDDEQNPEPALGVIEALIEGGADLDALSPNGATPKQSALAIGRKELAAFIERAEISRSTLAAAPKTVKTPSL